MEEKTIKTLVAMICITALETINLVYYGVDGTILVGAVAVLAGLGGYAVGKINVVK